MKVLDLQTQIIPNSCLAARVDLTLDFLAKAHGFPVADVSAQFVKGNRIIGQSFEGNGYNFSLVQNKDAVHPEDKQTGVLCDFRHRSAGIQKELIEIFRNLAGFTPDKITWLRPGLNQEEITSALKPSLAM